eukprot:m.1319138 g.1319138  ORF g.1319138 m.1319138 type:complete len:1102 (+) comp24843_c0_seq8:314-3619(+)
MASCILSVSISEGVSPTPASPPSGTPIIPGEEDEDNFELRAVPEEVAAVLRDGVIVEEEGEEEDALPEGSRDGNRNPDSATIKQMSATSSSEMKSTNLLNIRAERAERKISFSVTKGRLNAERALAAAHWVDKEIRKLISSIQKHGKVSEANGKYEVGFGILFKATENTMEALAGTLKTAKKHKVVGYESELLFQGQHDHIVITLLRDTIEDSDANTYTYRQVRSMSVSRKKLGKQFETKTLQNANSKCNACGKTVYTMEFVGAAGKAFHKSCFRCKVCKSTLRADNYSTAGKDFYCKTHYEAAFRANASYDFADNGADASVSSGVPITDAQLPPLASALAPDTASGASPPLPTSVSGTLTSAVDAVDAPSTDMAVNAATETKSEHALATEAMGENSPPEDATPVRHTLPTTADEAHAPESETTTDDGESAAIADKAQVPKPDTTSDDATTAGSPDASAAQVATVESPQHRLLASASSESMAPPSFSPAPPPAAPTSPAGTTSSGDGGATADVAVDGAQPVVNDEPTATGNAGQGVGETVGPMGAPDSTPAEESAPIDVSTLLEDDGNEGVPSTEESSAPPDAAKPSVTPGAAVSIPSDTHSAAEAGTMDSPPVTHDVPLDNADRVAPEAARLDMEADVAGTPVAPTSSDAQTTHGGDTSEYIDIHRMAAAEKDQGSRQNSEVEAASEGAKASAPDVLTLIGNMVGPQRSDTSDGERAAKRVGFGAMPADTDHADEDDRGSYLSSRVVSADSEGIVMLSDDAGEAKASTAAGNRDSVAAAFPQAINDKFIAANLHKIDHTKARPSHKESTEVDPTQFADIEAAAVAASYGHTDDEVFEAFRDNQFGHKDHSNELKRRALELKLLSSMLFKDAKALYPHVIDAPFDGAGLPLGTGERAEAMAAYTKSKKHDDSEVLYMTRLHKIDRATYAGKKDEIVVLTNAALYVISFAKPRTKYRVRYDQIKCVTVSSFYDGIMVLHAAGDMGDRIFDTSGTHCMEFVCNLVRAAHRSQQLRGAKVPVLCRSEIVHQIKGKKVGKIIFKLFGEAGTQIVKEGHQRCLQVTAPKIAGTAPHGMERPVSVASPQSPQSGVDTSDAKAWHEME